MDLVPGRVVLLAQVLIELQPTPDKEKEQPKASDETKTNECITQRHLMLRSDLTLRTRLAPEILL